MPRVAKGHLEQLPSGSFRVAVFAGWDPVTRRRLYLRATAKTEQQAQIELGRLLKDASDGRQPESGATVAKLMDEYAAIAEWDIPTRQTNEGFIRRTIKPALGHLEVRRYAARCSTGSTRGVPATLAATLPADRDPLARPLLRLGRAIWDIPRCRSRGTRSRPGGW
jgi:hypothetical protein